MYFKIANDSQDLTTLLPIWQRNLGKVYIGQTPIVDQQKKIILVITDVINNKYNIDVNEIAIKIDSSQSQAVISSLNNHIYTGSVTLNYQLDTSFVTLDYLVANLHIHIYIVEDSKLLVITVNVMKILLVQKMIF